MLLILINCYHYNILIINHSIIFMYIKKSFTLFISGLLPLSCTTCPIQTVSTFLNSSISPSQNVYIAVFMYVCSHDNSITQCILFCSLLFHLKSYHEHFPISGLSSTHIRIGCLTFCCLEIPYFI